MMKEFISKVVEGKNLSGEEAEQAMKLIMSGQATPAQIAGFLTALRMKGETIDEIAAFARVMREFAVRISPRVQGRLVDTCGTGGDRVKTFNISTIAAFVVAGAGVAIAKHGNRSVTSKAGSADLLEALGVNLELPPERVESIIESTGIGFMFAPLFHGAMKHAIGPRREIGIRTVFNVLGPLTNPANAQAQVLGVFDAALVEPLARVLARLGVEHALVVHGLEGMDEISTCGETLVAELKGGEVETYRIAPEDFGIERASPEELAGRDAQGNAEIARALLQAEEEGARRDIVVLNAAAGIYVAGRAKSIDSAIGMAERSIDSGRAHEKLLALIEASRQS
ncbi:anthranilate phosphoribosyltransferase [Candidatus Pyrohabitans sp.]